ncbi:tripartite tricarboxylate transporter TctB family protein [Zobellella sp. DQSA1]|uniref:tripartite tricarboxylate transporter TctB family protein n=1 Tax=Zobellella sp. DQSA1 TaxID=3342386 RepID=UPI0035C063B7
MNKLNINQKIGIILALLALGYLWMAFQIPGFSLPRPVDSDAFPKALGSALLLLAILLFLEKPRHKAQDDEEQDDIIEESGGFWTSPRMRVVITSVAIVAYAFALQPIGFVVTSILLCCGLACYYGYRNHKANLLASSGVVLALYFMMSYVMDVYLPTGILPF